MEEWDSTAFYETSPSVSIIMWQRERTAAPNNFIAIPREAAIISTWKGETPLAASDPWLDKMLKLSERTDGSDLPAGDPSSLKKRESRKASASANAVGDDATARSETVTVGR